MSAADAHAEHGHGHQHGHTHGGVDASITRSRAAMRTLALSLAVLGATAAVQVVVVLLSGSVALLADTVHNIGDALTAIPLGAAFLLGRRPPTRRLPYGWGRAEDLAGIVVLLVILFSAGYAAYEAIDRLLDPQRPGYLLATAVAGVIGFLGNEWVAVYRIRAGRRLGSAALEADGHHARVDGFTSLAVVAGAAGVALGFELADPLVGLAISAVILRIVWQSGREVLLRALDGVEPELLDRIERTAGTVPGVVAVPGARARWVGHAIHAEVRVAVDPRATVAQADAIAGAVEHRLLDADPLWARRACGPPARADTSSRRHGRPPERRWDKRSARPCPARAPRSGIRRRQQDMVQLRPGWVIRPVSRSLRRGWSGGLSPREARDLPPPHGESSVATTAAGRPIRRTMAADATRTARRSRRPPAASSCAFRGSRARPRSRGRASGAGPTAGCRPRFAATR